MKNLGFQIRLNGELICRAEIDSEFFTTHCILTSLHREADQNRLTDLFVGGLDSNLDQSVIWTKEALKKGDQILIEVVEGDFEPPKTVSKRNSEELILQEKIKYFLRLKEELKEHLEE
ncbi:hypothetical protein [Algoriphagus sp. AK58]|uniref:hypothetical protein n=1 Tax=Algoriphagus sp. AK58 TaxID=1406877 RepID=UPI00164F7015|nr:hypothetical protein [Algoriphagus sp. AK58]MBC6368518.1 hypothetical protein [Algoriphagus sp. AK58]